MHDGLKQRMIDIGCLEPRETDDVEEQKKKKNETREGGFRARPDKINWLAIIKDNSV
ncbi:hypothetical protein K2173_016493 [Erythroxylum novogranatense]|uniref:Uncharacterized protein n=1 Tax=Erythroxylum novogranatense TaxID=1862640 RepID=A0AAV8SGD8_9ROSI|nr:hypothetical protein K2173_016493 [Erythroxylum novogranatense]